MTKYPISVTTVVAGALVDGDGRVLVQRRPAGGAQAGLWEFPGGKVDPGEAPPAALARELAEELGIAVDADALVPIAFAEESLADGRWLLLLLYRCPAWRGEPAALHADALRWAAPAELTGLPMPPADRPLVAALAQSLRRQ